MQASGSAHWYNLWEAASHPLVKSKMHTHPREILRICTGDQYESVTEHCGKHEKKKHPRDKFNIYQENRCGSYTHMVEYYRAMKTNELELHGL